MRHRLGSESHTWVSTCTEFAQQRTPSICAILTRSATDFAPIFFIMRPRSTLTGPSWAAIFLLLCPVETRAKTSRSREARVSKRACRFEQPSHGCIASDRVRLRRDGIQHVLVPKRFDQEIDSSSLHGPDGRRNIAMAGHENDWDVNIRLGELDLKVT